MDYLLRNIDPALWARVKARAEREGHPLRWVLLQLLKRYAATAATKDTMKALIFLVALLASGCAFDGATSPSRPPPVDVPRPPLVEPVPESPAAILLSLSVSPSPVRARTATHLSVTGSGTSATAPVRYVWTLGDGLVVATAEGRLTHTYGSIGTFQAHVAATDATGRTGDAALTVTVIGQEPGPAPTPPPPPASPPTLTASLTCTARTAGTPTPCNVAASYGGAALASTAITSVAWEWGDGTTVDASSSGPLNQHSYTQAGVYGLVVEVTATTSDGVKTARSTKTLTIP